jgi:hypothetical protein
MKLDHKRHLCEEREAATVLVIRWTDQAMTTAKE